MDRMRCPICKAGFVTLSHIRLCVKGTRKQRAKVKKPQEGQSQGSKASRVDVMNRGRRLPGSGWAGKSQR